jgi:hypothetical protein
VGNLDGWAVLGGLAAVVLFFGSARAVSQRGAAGLITGADGKSSTSKFQFFLWTAVIVFSYVALFVARWERGTIRPVGEIPTNVLITLGFSATTLAAAKAITTAYVANGRLSPGSSVNGGLLTDDAGQSDLAKTQLVAWTFIGVFVYLVTVFKADPGAGLPDIDGALMVLMGLGHGAYLGKKLVTTDTPRLFSITPLVRPGQKVVISGASLGSLAGTVFLGGRPLAGVALDWQEQEISFALPAQQPGGAPWLGGQTVDVGVDVAANRLSFVIGPPPQLVRLVPEKARVGDVVEIQGQGLSGTLVTVDVGGTLIVAAAPMSDDKLQLRVPAVPVGPGVRLTVCVDGMIAPRTLLLEIIA